MFLSRKCVYDKPGHSEMVSRIKDNSKIYTGSWWKRIMSPSSISLHALEIHQRMPTLFSLMQTLCRNVAQKFIF